MGAQQPSNPRVGRVEKIRPAKACNVCRRKKVKCDGKRPICSSCTIFNLPCEFEDTGKQSKQSRKAYVEELEQRVKQMDDELQRLGQAEESSQQNDRKLLAPHASSSRLEDLAPGNSATGRREDESLLMDTSPREDETSQTVRETSDQPSYVIRAQDGKMRFFGASSGFSMHGAERPKSPNDEKSKSGLDNAVKRGASQWPLTNWVPRILQDSFEQRTSQALPSKETTLCLVAEFLSDFNQIIPLVDESAIACLVEKRFSWNPDESPSSWALLNVVLAFSYKQRAQRATDASTDWQCSLGHIKNALNVLVDLFLHHADLPAVQALLGLALYFQGTPNAQALFMLAASAMRLAHSIGLHRNTTLGFSPAEIEERRRTFWISFILDADISLRVGRPPVQDADDYNTPLPAELPHDGRGIISIDGTRVNFFRQLAQFATIQRSVYRHLQNMAVASQPKEDTFRSATECENALLQWESSASGILDWQELPSSRPECSREHVFRLSLAYRCCHASLRQLPLAAHSINGASSREAGTEMDKEISLLYSRAVKSARSALESRSYLQGMAPTYKWNVIYFFATASVALASEICTNPTRQIDCEGNVDLSDMSLVGGVATLLEEVSREEPGTFVDFMLSVCSDLDHSARRAIRKEQASGIGRSATGTTDTEFSISEGQHPTELTEGGIFTDIALNDSNFDSFNAQWSVPPFWNLQDMLTGMP